MSEATFDPEKSYGIGGFNLELAIREHAPIRIQKIERELIELRNDQKKKETELRRLRRLLIAVGDVVE